jgi:Transposase IS66 family
VAASHQVIDVPLVSAAVTQYDEHAVECACGRRHAANKKQPPGRMLLECLNDRQADVLRFLADLRIPPTSNQAERDLRPAKTQQKISGRLRSETAARHRYAICGYISTAAKHGEDIITAIRDALGGNPLDAPIPQNP